MLFDNPKVLVLQAGVNTKEIRVCSTWARLIDCHILYLDLKNLKNVALGTYGSAVDILPVGSVEFVKAVAGLYDIDMPDFDCYPADLWMHFRRDIHRSYLRDVLPGDFVKPVKTKLFTGHIFQDSEVPDYISDEIIGLPPETAVYLSDRVDFVSEWRYYVQQKSVIGMARYDDSDSEAMAAPPFSTIEMMIHRYNNDTAYALDVGILSTGSTALVEVNDAWAIGLYGEALTPREYVQFLYHRWKEIA